MIFVLDIDMYLVLSVPTCLILAGIFRIMIR
jgi:hypothetical protein